MITLHGSSGELTKTKNGSNPTGTPCTIQLSNPRCLATTGKKCFEQYRIASGLTTSTKEQQVGTLLDCIGEATESVLSSTNATEEQKKYDTVIEKFYIFFKVRRNVIYKHTRFNRRNQQRGETTEQYITELYRFAENCEYGTLKDEMIHDRLRSFLFFSVTLYASYVWQRTD